MRAFLPRPQPDLSAAPPCARRRLQAQARAAKAEAELARMREQMAALTAQSQLLRPTGPKVALCVGVSKYTYSGCIPLTYPAKDAADVAAALRRVGYTATVLQDAAATAAGIRSALEDFSAALGPGGCAFFYFSGHGLTGPDGKNYLLTYSPVRFLEDLEDEARHPPRPSRKSL
jgi:hypothetical protein